MTESVAIGLVPPTERGDRVLVVMAWILEGGSYHAILARAAKEFGIEVGTAKGYFTDALRFVQQRPSDLRQWYEVRRGQLEHQLQVAMDVVAKAETDQKPNALRAANQVLHRLIQIEGHYPESKRVIATTLAIQAQTSDAILGEVRQRLSLMSEQEIIDENEADLRKLQIVRARIDQIEIVAMSGPNRDDPRLPDPDPTSEE